jgi:hypothetical protein
MSWTPSRQVTEDLLACLLRMMVAVRDHRGAAAGPVTHENLVTCLHLAPFKAWRKVEHVSWLSPREFPALKPQSREPLQLELFGPRGNGPDYTLVHRDFALVHRVAETLGLPSVDEPLVKELLGVLWEVGPCLRSFAWVPLLKGRGYYTDPAGRGAV